MILAILGSVVDDGSEKETDGDRPLVPGDDGTTDPLWRALGLVHGDESRDQTDTETGEETTDDEGCPVVSAGLESDTKREDNACDNDTDTTTEDIRGGSAAKGA